jgi:hypothetical protein
MSHSKEMEQGGTAVKALAAAAATGAATYAVRKALATRNGHDDENAAEDEGDEVSTKRGSSEEQAEESDNSEHVEDEDEDEPTDSTEDENIEEAEADEDDERETAPEGSAEEEDEDDEDDEPDESNGSGGSGSLRQLVNPSRLASLSHLLVPLAGEAADSAGRYVAEHTSDAVQQNVVSRFIDAFEEAS